MRPCCHVFTGICFVVSQLPAGVSVNGQSDVLSRVRNVSPAATSSITDKRHQLTSSVPQQSQQQQQTTGVVTGKRPGIGH